MSAGSEDRARRASPARDAAPIVYREALRVPWWWYPVGLLVTAILAAEFHSAGQPISDWLSFGILLPLSVIVVWSLGRGRLEVTAGPDGDVGGGEVRIRGAHIGVAELSGVVGLDARTVRKVVGREGDPAAFVQIRPWIGPGVQLWLDDPDDPAPYWVISTRHPAHVVDLIRSGL